MRITFFFTLLAAMLWQVPTQAQFTGCEFNQEAYELVPKVAVQLQREYGSVPSSYSLKPYCPIPRNQGNQGSCVGWSTTYAARTLVDAIANGWTNKATITSNGFSPSYTYNQIKLGSECSRGSYISSALQLLTDQGAPKLSEFPYECNRRVTAADKARAKNHKIKGYRRLAASSNVSIIELIKKSLAEKKPVVIGMMVYKSFQNTRGVWNGVQDQRLGGHAMSIIGYDDNKYGGAVEIMNSWGKNWGNEGFIWVRYSDLKTNTFEYYELLEPVNAPKPQKEETDLSGKIELIQDNGNTMNASLQRNANRDFNIVAVPKSTYLLDKSYSSGTQFRVYVSNNQPAYVYILGYGSRSGNVSPLYPFDNYSAYLNYKSNQIAFPNESYYIQMDGNIGKDYLCILYSKEKLNIKDLATRISNASGSINTKIKAALKHKLVDGGNIKFERKSIAFEAKTKGKSIIPIVIEVNHVR